MEHAITNASGCNTATMCGRFTTLRAVVLIRDAHADQVGPEGIRALDAAASIIAGTLNVEGTSEHLAQVVSSATPGTLRAATGWAKDNADDAGYPMAHRPIFRRLAALFRAANR